ncbi:MAG: D-2-hydroxyacid dehydrogenase [Pseudomonadota bacterium]
MSFNLLLLRGIRSETNIIDELVDALQREALDVKVTVAATDDEAKRVIGETDAAFGYFSESLLEAAPQLRWLACPQAGPDPAFFNRRLVESDVVVTNVRGIFSDHISAHIMAFVLGFSRGLPAYLDQQRERRWAVGVPTIFLPEATAVIVGVGAIGAETALRCSEFGMRVIGVDPRVSSPPPGVSSIVTPEQTHRVVGEGDFVISTVPQSPVTEGYFDTAFFGAMKSSGYFINIGRGATVRLADLNAALRSGEIAGAALDVFEEEPLPVDHPLWDAPGMVITPHVATVGPYLDNRRVSVFVENCRRFARDEPLLNVVDKRQWY